MSSAFLLALLCAPTAAVADDTPERGVTASLAGGAFWFSEDEHLEDSWTVVPRIGWQFEPRHGIELETGYIQGLTELDKNSFSVTPRLNYLYAPFANNDRRVQPFVAAGPGVIRKEVNRDYEEDEPNDAGYGNYVNPDVDILLNAGPGLSLALTERASLRTDLRYVLNLGDEPHGDRADAFSDLEWTAGLWFTPGEGPRDTDADGLVDSEDDCVTEPEDHDGFLDYDGCPDTDNDMDGYSDAEDVCPQRPEDFDLFQDGNGCPDVDNDLDGFIDVDDLCPYTPGLAAGCPEAREAPTAQSNIWIEDNRLVLADEVYFELDSADIEARSFHILDDLAWFINGDQDIGIIEIAGHADSQGGDAYNEKLSYERAESVHEYLVRSGVSDDRLLIFGYGEDLPDATNQDALGRAWNRRVEFTLLSYADASSDAQ